MMVLAAKLHIPKPSCRLVVRARLNNKLNEGLYRKLTLVCAPAGYGKTTLVSEWASDRKRLAAWLSLDASDNDPIRFLTHLLASLRRIGVPISEDILKELRLSYKLPNETFLTTLLNNVANMTEHFTLILEDYHMIESELIDDIICFLIDYMPSQMHLVVTTRTNPNIQLAKLRASRQLIELGVADLSFTLTEAAQFLTQIMKLKLSKDVIAVMEAKTEGWIAGLQLAALSMQGQLQTSNFIKIFNGNHRYILEYLVEEVLKNQTEEVQIFLLQTSILERMTASLCDAVLINSSINGQKILEQLVHANLFLIPLDEERYWYRYHHLFSDLLQQRLQQKYAGSKDSFGVTLSQLHIRASIWYEKNNFELEAFHHAVAANDYERAERIIEGTETPLYSRGLLEPILRWFQSLSRKVFNEHPSLWITYASVLLGTGQTTQIETILRTAECALQDLKTDDKKANGKTDDLIGRIAVTRSMYAVSQNQAEIIIREAEKALEYLNPQNLTFRITAINNLGYAYYLLGERDKAKKAYNEALFHSKESGNIIINILASIGLGTIQEMENQLHMANQTYQRILNIAKDLPFPVISEAYLGLARISYQWNELNKAEKYVLKSITYAKHIINTDRLSSCEILLANIKIVQGDFIGAAKIANKVEQLVHQHKYVNQIREVEALQVRLMLQKRDLEAANTYILSDEPSISKVRILLFQDKVSDALKLLELLQEQAQVKKWQNEKLKIMILKALAFQANENKDKAVSLLNEALKLAELEGFIRIFLDEGENLKKLLSEAAVSKTFPEYVRKLKTAFKEQANIVKASSITMLIEPLSQRELEILRLIESGLSNQEIAARLYLALDTVKGHNRRIYSKLSVRRRTEAIARAKDLGLL